MLIVVFPEVAKTVRIEVYGISAVYWPLIMDLHGNKWQKTFQVHLYHLFEQAILLLNCHFQKQKPNLKDNNRN